MRSEFEASLNEASLRETQADFSVHARGIARKLEFLKTTCQMLESEEHLQDVISSAPGKKVVLRYLRSPVDLLGEERVYGVRLERMRLTGEAGSQKAVPDEPQDIATVNCQLLIKSIGYKSQPIIGVPFNTKTHTVPHHQGCVLTPAGPQPGLYVAGWLKRGPSGIIDSTLRDSVETFRIIKHHLDCDMLPARSTSPQQVADLLAGHRTVDYSDWQQIDRVERQRGAEAGKTREKVLCKDEMLGIIQ